MAATKPARTCAAVAATLAAALGQQAGEPTRLGGGPVVCHSVALAEKPLRTGLYVAECDGDRPARRIWTNVGNARVLARLDRDRLLVAGYGEPYALLVVDTRSGAHRLLAEGSPHDFVAVHGDEALFLGDHRQGASDHFLYARSWRTPAPPRRLADHRFRSVPLVAGNAAFATDGLEVWVISLTRGKGRRLYTLPAGAAAVRLCLSPAGQRLAVGCNAGGKGHLAVVDIGSGEVVLSQRNLHIALSMVSSSQPTLEVGWSDEEHVVTSETIGQKPGRGFFAYVRRKLATGDVVDETEYGPIGLNHTPPPGPTSPRTPPLFTVSEREDGYALYRRGRGDPVATAARGRHGRSRIATSPDGQYAIVLPGKKGEPLQLHRNGRPPLLLRETTATDFVWLPAATAPSNPPRSSPGNRK